MADYIYYVTVSGSAFLIDGESQAELGLKAGLTYRFDVSDASCASQTFKFSTTSDGTHGGGSEYTTNVTVTGTAGSSGAVVDLVVPSSTGTLYYYNGAASGYGGTIRYTTDTYVSTTNLGLKVPLPGASDDVWASHLNASLRTIDSATGKFDSGYGSVATAYGCRAWVNFNGTGTVAIGESGNVSSITDLGTGSYQINIATAMPDANYTVVGSSTSVVGIATTTLCTTFRRDTDVRVNNTTTATTISTCNSNNSTALDCADVNISIFR